MVLPIATITLGELQTFVKRQFGDESGIQIVDSDITRWVNMAALEIVSKNKILQASASTTGIANQRDYDISALVPDVIAIADISYNGVSLVQSDQSEVKKLLPYSVTGSDTTPLAAETGTPVYWYSWGNSIKLWPVPTVAGVLSIDYIKAPAKVSSPGHLLPLPDVYYERLCNFVLSKAYELDEDVPNSTNQRQMFEDKLVEMTGLTETRAGSFPIVRDDYAGGYYLGNDEWGY